MVSDNAVYSQLYSLNCPPSIWNDWILANWPYDERLFFTVGSMIVTTMWFWLLNGLLFLVYHFDLFSKYKIQGSKWPSRELIIKCCRELFVTHFIVRPLTLYFIFYDMFKWFGMESSCETLPSGDREGLKYLFGRSRLFPFLHQDNVITRSVIQAFDELRKVAGDQFATTAGTVFIIVFQLVLAALFCDAVFYWTHRMLHHRLIYKYIHKRHHEFKTSIGIASEYAHPLEDLISNSTSTLGVPLLLGFHTEVTWIWLMIRLTETWDAHSGYNFPWSPWSLFSWQGGCDRHDFHHSHNVGSYGAFTVFWDWITGTDLSYKNWKQKTAKKVD